MKTGALTIVDDEVAIAFNIRAGGALELSLTVLLSQPCKHLEVCMPICAIPPCGVCRSSETRVFYDVNSRRRCRVKHPDNMRRRWYKTVTLFFPARAACPPVPKLSLVTLRPGS